LDITLGAFLSKKQLGEDFLDEISAFIEEEKNMKRVAKALTVINLISKHYKNKLPRFAFIDMSFNVMKGFPKLFLLSVLALKK